MISDKPCPGCGDYMTEGAEIRNGEKIIFNFCCWCWYDERKQKKTMQDVGGTAQGGFKSKVE